MSQPSRPSRPYVLLSAAVSLDGCLDDAGPERLLLSNAEDFDRVDAVRASCDAILVGAGTLRADRPRLLVKSARRRADRVATGLPAYPLKVAVTASGDLDAGDPFWTTGGDKVVYTTDAGAALARERLGALAEVVALGDTVDWERMLDDLASAHGVRRLMAEGAPGSTPNCSSAAWPTRCSWHWRRSSWANRTRPGSSALARTPAAAGTGCGSWRPARSATWC